MNVASPQPLSPDLYNHALECGVIGAVLLYPGVYAQVQPLLKPAHFHERFLGEVYEWIGQQHGDGAAAGDALQWACLTSVSHIDKGKETIAHCIALTVVPIDVPYAVKELVALAERRRLIAAAEQIAGKAQAGGDDLLSSAITLIAQDDGQDALGVTRSVYTLAEAVGDLDGPQIEIQTAHTGSERLQRDLGGWRARRLYVIGGRPGSGKTTLATSLLLQTARRGFGVGYFSLEMAANEIGYRCIADLAFTSNSPIAYSRIERRSLVAYEQQRVDQAREQFEGLPFQISDRAAPTLAELRIEVQAMQRRFRERGGRLDVVAVDHLGLIKPSGDYRGNKVAETGEISAGLKALAKDLDVAVVALCQLNREVEGRESKRPTLADLRWAGEIEQDADVVLMVYREAYYLDSTSTDFDKKQHELEILIRKNRSGAVGNIKMFVDVSAAHVRDLRQ